MPLPNGDSAQALNFPNGLVKVCHAELVELVVPWIEKRPAPLAAVCRAVARYREIVDLRARRSSTVLPGALPAPPENLSDLLEALRCLAARLASWQLTATPAGATRREQITTFLRRRNTE